MVFTVARFGLNWEVVVWVEMVASDLGTKGYMGLVWTLRSSGAEELRLERKAVGF